MENTRPNSVTVRSSLKPFKCDGCKKPCPECIEGLVMESFQSKSGVCPPTDIHGQNQQGLWKAQRRARELVKGLEHILGGATQGAGVVQSGEKEAQ